MLGVSPHTVDMRLRTAMKTLGVASRIEAARLLVQEDIALGLVAPEPYQPLVYQASELVSAQEFVTFGSPASDKVGADESDSDPRLHRSKPSLDVGPPASGPPRLAGASISVATAAMNEKRPEVPASDPGYDSRPLLNSLPWGAKNDLAIGTRLGWIFAISVGSALAFGAILAALAALKSLI